MTGFIMMGVTPPEMVFIGNPYAGHDVVNIGEKNEKQFRPVSCWI